MPRVFAGTPQDRVDGPLKVTGAARYAAEYTAPDLVHGVIVSSTVARGRIRRIDTSAAEALDGVIRILTHENRPRTAWFGSKYQDQVAPPGSPFRALYDADILYSNQPVALVLADDLETARDAASLVRVEYETAAHRTDLHAAQGDSYVPPKKRSGIEPPPPPRGDADAALAASPFKVEVEYEHPDEFHNPMEPHATTVVRSEDGSLLVHDKTQGVMNALGYITGVFGLKAKQVRVVAPFVGGAFGASLRPQYQLFLAVMAALELKRSVRVVMTRSQMFSVTHRPATIERIAIGAAADGKLRAIRHQAIAATSRFEDYQENVVNWSGLLYRCDNVALDYRLVQLDRYTPGDMRAPGAPTGLLALECAMDELSYELGMDPLALRLHNYAEDDQNTNKPITSKQLRAAYAQGAEKFGWSRRSFAPRSMREGHELIGWGMATGVWEAMMMKTSARAVFTADGKLEIASATADIGTGTTTILTQIAADALGVPMHDVTVKIGDSALPEAPVEGGSWTAASAGSAVQAACDKVREKLFLQARGMDNSPLANTDLSQVVFFDGRIAVVADPARYVTLREAFAGGQTDRIEVEESAERDPEANKKYTAFTHSAVFVEVRIDEELGVLRVTRLVEAIAAGRILNPKTARSQIVGGAVFGIGMALHEETLQDHNLGRIMNSNLAEYHMPASADVPDIDVIFVEEHDTLASPIGVKGLGEIGLCGTAAAIANAVFHATGKRVRALPMTIDRVLSDGE